MSIATIQAFDGRNVMLVDPHEIKAGDWMRDLGRLRHVEAVEASSSPIAPCVLVRFSDGEDGQFATLSIPESVTATVWRTLTETADVDRV